MRISEIMTLKDLGFYINFPFPSEEKLVITNAIKNIKIPPKQGEIQKKLESELTKTLKKHGYFSSETGDTECRLWMPEFQHAVDFYNPDKKIAIEVEKAEIKRIMHDLLKLVNATKTFRPKIKYGVLIVPNKYFIRSGVRNFISTIKQEISFYFSNLLGDSGLLDLLIISYEVKSK